MALPEPDSRPDEALVRDANRGDPTAFETLYRRYREWVVRLSYRFTSNEDDALDVLQDTFAYLLGKFPGFCLTARMTTFLYPAVKNLSLDRVRNHRRYVSNDELVASIGDPPEEKSATRRELAAVMAALPDAQREVVLMRFVDAMKLDEIADALEIPLGTVKSRLHNALKVLREDERTKSYFKDFTGGK